MEHRTDNITEPFSTDSIMLQEQRWQARNKKKRTTKKHTARNLNCFENSFWETDANCDTIVRRCGVIEKGVKGSGGIASYRVAIAWHV